MFKTKRAHLIGIGGMGLSAIARMFLEDGTSVSGSDKNPSSVTRELESLGAKIFPDHRAENIFAECDLVVYSNAVPQDNPERLEARKRGTRTLSYPEMLGEISREQLTIAVSGNAGKTTTTALVGQILINAGLEPTIIVGSLANFTDKAGNIRRTNFVSGSGKYLVVEADEYKRAFLNLEPSILAINNIGEDHLDYYQDLTDIQDAFKELANKVPKEGFIICSTKDKNVLPALSSIRATVLDYSSIDLSGYLISMPGEHNRNNTQVAVALASLLGIKETIIKDSIGDFKGIWRRLEYKGETEGGVLVYDDYAHNPQKIISLVSGLKEKFPDKRIIVIFQPHLFSRTKQMLGALSESFAGVHRLIVTPIYAAREDASSFDITHKTLAEAIIAGGAVDQVETVDSLEEVAKMISMEGKESICLTVGAGDVYTIADKLIN